jgi:hypothetical protein
MDQFTNPRASSRSGNPDSTRTMDLTSVMPQRIQPPQNAPQRQTPPHLPSRPSISHSRPLPSIPSSMRLEPQISSNNIEHRPVSSTNNIHRPFYDTNVHLPPHNTQYCPLYDTNVLPVSSTYMNFPTSPPVYHSNTRPRQQNHLSPTPLISPHFLQPPVAFPTIKEPITPTTPTYIPILTGRSDWCPWSEALMTAVMGMNLFGHIAECYDDDPHWGFDPGSVPMYPPVITHSSTLEEHHARTLWWLCDSQVLHLLVSHLSPSARAQLPGTGNSQPRRHTARSVYQALVRLFGGTDFHTAAVAHDELIALRCAPTRVTDYITSWRSGLNRLVSTGHLFDHADSIRHFVNHLPVGSTYDIVWESVLFSLSTA